MNVKLQTKLLQICKKHRIAPYEYLNYNHEAPRYNIYPYSPYIPANWNHILVLGISQNISIRNKGNKEYRESLLDALDEDLIFRLGNEYVTKQKPGKFIGVEPWDDGLLKLAMLSCFPEFGANQFGVANALPWELSKEDKSLNSFLEDKSIAFWNETLPVLKPKYIIMVGEAVNDVITCTDYCRTVESAKTNDCNLYKLLPYRYFTYLINLFDSNDIINRFPEVKHAIKAHPSLVNIIKKYKGFYILYAAHAVSKIKPNLKVN
jgi:hypothetical protein